MKLIRNHSVQYTLCFSLTALILYFPANLFPFMRIEMYGRVSSPTIWGGIAALAESGDLFIAGVVFLASFLFPLLKILILFFLSLTAGSSKNHALKDRLYRFVEAIGRWSMLDIFLLAVMITIMKLQARSSVEPGLGAILFIFVVIFTMLASSHFQPNQKGNIQNAKLAK